MDAIPSQSSLQVAQAHLIGATPFTELLSFACGTTTEERSRSSYLDISTPSIDFISSTSIICRMGRRIFSSARSRVLAIHKYATGNPPNKNYQQDISQRCQ